MAVRKRHVKISDQGIQQRQPKEPDILCEIQGVGPVAFELTECVDSDVAQNFANKFKLEQWLREEYEVLPQNTRSRIDSSIGKAFVWVNFLSGTTLQARRRDIPKLLRLVSSLKPGFEGMVQEPLPVSVIKLKIKPNVCKRIVFHVSGTTSFEDQLIAAIQKKLEKSYETSAVRIELLAYYSLQGSLPKDFWIDELRSVVLPKLATAGFARLWVFDAGHDKILFAHKTEPQIK